MKAILKNIMLLSSVVMPLLCSCSSSDDVVAGPLEENTYLHPYGASAADQALQTSFYEKNKIYVLFNDTISKTQVSVNPDGTPYYDFEDVNMGYSLMGYEVNTKASVFRYKYLEDKDKAAAVDFLSNSLLPSLGKSLRPFSFLLVDGIDYVYSYYGSDVWSSAEVWAGWRCTAIAMKGIGTMSAEEKNAFRLKLLQAIVSNKISSIEASKFDEFYSFCNDYYSKYAMREDADPFLAKYPTTYDFGLLSAYSWGQPNGFSIYNIKAKEYDLEDYTNALFATSEAEFMAQYGQYPIVVKKYQILKAIIEELGVIF